MLIIRVDVRDALLFFKVSTETNSNNRKEAALKKIYIYIVRYYLKKRDQKKTYINPSFEIEI
jgi:hypothetical protein